MTRLYLQALADALKAAHPGTGNTVPRNVTAAWHQLVRDVADICQASKHAFDRARFVQRTQPAGTEGEWVDFPTISRTESC